MSQFLETARYQQALANNSRQKESNQSSLELFLGEKCATQTALERLGVENDVAPQEIPGIDQLHIRHELLQLLPPDFMIDIVGMPNTGKSEFSDFWLRECWRFMQVRFIQEAAMVIPRSYDEPWTFHEQTRSLLRAEIIDRHVETDPVLMPRPLRKGPFLVMRGLTDRIAFSRVDFERGVLPPEIFAQGPQHYTFNKHKDPIPLPVGAVVLLLARPEISLRREPARTSPAKTMTPEYLTSLYIQTLRLYHELKSGELTNADFTAVDMPIPIVAALNMEGDDYEANRQKFIDTLEEIIYLTENKNPLLE